jgi:hypothetical protein
MKPLLVALILLLLLGIAGRGDLEDAERYEAFRQQMIVKKRWTTATAIQATSNTASLTSLNSARAALKARLFVRHPTLSELTFLQSKG